jgi:hypothetical protein
MMTQKEFNPTQLLIIIPPISTPDLTPLCSGHFCPFFERSNKDKKLVFDDLDVEKQVRQRQSVCL